MVSRADYEPLDLVPWCTGQIGDVVGAPAPTGLQHFHGIPFQIGDRTGATDKPFVVLDAAAEPIRIPVGTRARHVLVAHRLLDGDADIADGTGRTVARYVFRLADATTSSHDIRRRFHIDIAPAQGWDMDLPFEAVLSSTPAVPDRRAGQWERLGERRSEGCLALPPSYFLWTWTNPTPDVPVDSIEIVPQHGRLLVAGITLGHADGHPFVRSAAVPLHVQVRDGGSTPDPLDLQISVDRGAASYTYPVTAASLEDFLAVPVAGWGRAARAAAGGYAHVAGTPTATVAVRSPDGELARVKWADLSSGSPVTQGPVELRLGDGARNWVHVTVVDDATGRPVPCRVHFRSPDGVAYQPHGHHEYVSTALGSGGDVRLGGVTYAYIDGTCQGWLPRGQVVAEVARGFEYEPLCEVLTVDPGTRELTLRLRRWVSMNDRGWYSGDSHAHFLTAQGAAFEQRAEDLNVVNLLATQWGALFTTTEEFTGRDHGNADESFVTYVSQENRQHILGHLVLWGLRQPVMPWCTDGLPEAAIGTSLDATLSDWADRCHEQGGTVVVPHIPRPNGELAALVATGRADALEMIVQHRAAHDEYYRYLNCGYRMPLVGGTDKMSAEVAIGQYRTYAHLGDDEFSYDAWRRAVKAGRTFLSGGPLLDLTVDGFGLGDPVPVSGGGTVQVRGTAEGVFPMHSLELVHNGRVVATAEDAAGTRRLTLDTPLTVEEDGWVALRVGGPGYFGSSHHDIWQRGIFAHTSPVYLATGRDWDRYDARVAGYMTTLLRGALSYVRHTAAHASPGNTMYHHGEDDHLAFLERPFREALAALDRRARPSA
jgi:hypothetical protein